MTAKLYLNYKPRTVFSKIERAKEHIDDLQVATQAFFNSDPYEILSKVNPDVAERTYYLGRLADVSDEICVICGDALHNLRTALDHLAYQIVLRATGKKPSRRIDFPIAATADKYMAAASRREIQLARPDAVKLIDGLKPYKGGNDTLWRLKELDDIDKHRLLLAVGTRYVAHRATPTERHRLRTMFVNANPGKPVPHFIGTLLATKDVRMLKSGDELRTIPESEVEDHMQFNFTIAFNEPGICEGEPMIETLHQMEKLVRGIVIELDPF